VKSQDETLEDWCRALLQALELDDVEIDVNEVLALAGVAAHSVVRPAAPPAPDSAALEARISAEVAKRLEPTIAAAVAASEARQAQRAAQLVAETEKRLDFDRRADRAAFEETLSVLQKKFNVLYLASAELGVRR